MVTAEKRKAAEVTGRDSLLRARNLLRIAIYNINIRGLFLEKYFNDKSVPALEMKIKKLMPMDAESRRLIDWMEKGVYDALQKKYLKTLLFCICEKEEGPMIEEYAFSFSYPNTNGEEVAMNMSRTGSKKNSATFKSNAAEVTPDQMRISACKMMRTLVSLMRTLDQMPEERTILMKLLYYDETTPEDYESPFFKGCAENETVNIWNKNPLKMEVGNVNSKHLVLALKVKSVLDPCDANDANSDDDKMSLGHESDQDDDFTDTEVRPSEVDRYVVAPNDGTGKGQSGTNSEDETQDAAHEEELTAQVRAWICSRDMGTVNASDVLSNYPDISLEMVEDILERLLKDGLLSRAGKDGYAVKKVTDPKTPYIKKEVAMHNVSPTEETKNMYMKAMNLLRIAIYNISYIRGLFPEKYFNDKSVPALEIKIKKLMPMDAESRRLIDWMEKGVYDALQKKYLKTLLLCICEKEEGPMIEEYAFSFSFPSSNGEEVAMNMSRTGSKKNSATFKSNAAEVTPDQKRSSTLTIAKLQGKRDGEANQSTVRKLIDKMVQDGYIKNSGNRRLGKSAVHLEVTNKIFLQAATGSVPSKSSNAAVSGKECSNIRAPSNCPTRKENIDASSSGNGEDPNRGNARNVSSNDAIPLIRVTVRRLSDLTALDPVLVILVLSSEDSVENRITLVREGRHRGFLFAKNQAFRQACLRMFMEGYIAIEAAAEEIGDPDYEAAEDLPAGEDGHEEEEEGAQEEEEEVSEHQGGVAGQPHEEDGHDEEDAKEEEEEVSEHQGGVAGQPHEEDGHDEEDAKEEEEVSGHQGGVAGQPHEEDGHDEEDAKEEEEVNRQEGELAVQQQGGVQNERDALVPQVTVRRLSDFTALDPANVILVLSAEDSVENRITLAREGRHRGFLFAKNQSFRQACLRMFMEGYIAIEAAAEEIGDPDYEAAEDLPAGEDGHEEEEDGQHGEAAGQQEGQDEVELQQEEGEEEDQGEDGEEDEEHEDEEALPSDDSKADDDWSLIEHVKIDDAQDGDQEEVPQQEEGEDEDEEDDWSLMDDDEINDPDYSPSSGVESDDSGSIDFCDDSWLWFTSESDSEANDDDSDYLPSSASD